MRQNSDRLAKSKTHLFQAGKTENEINENEHITHIIDFIHNNRNKSDLDFLYGYGIHILTDILWKKRIYSDFLYKYRKDKTPIQEERWAYYNDTDRLDYVLFDESSWREQVWSKLKKANATDFIDLLSADEINAWNYRTLHWYDGECQHNNPIRYITKSDILSFISEASAVILEKLK
jgi:hypothetical protein